jgi:hypothetical protein
MANHIPQRNGQWQNPQAPGNCQWFPDLNWIPESSNDPYTPHTFKRIIVMNYLKPLSFLGVSIFRKIYLIVNLFRLSHGLVGIRFINNEPDFHPFAIATVKIKGYLDTRYGSEGTMPNADKILAARLGVREGIVRQWINDNQYVWHERQNGRHIDLVTHDIHGNIPHTGGIAMNKRRKGK